MDKVKNYLKKQQKLRVDFLKFESDNPGKIGITILPGRKDRNRNNNYKSNNNFKYALHSRFLID